MKKTRAEATKDFESQPRTEVVVGPMCFCLSFEYTHLPAEHKKKLRSDHDWRTWEQLKNTQMFRDRIS